MANASLHNFRNSWRIKFLGGSLIVLLVCEILLILDVVSESLYFDFDIYTPFTSEPESPWAI